MGIRGSSDATQGALETQRRKEFFEVKASNLLTADAGQLYVATSSGGSTFLQRGSPPPPPWRLPPERSF